MSASKYRKLSGGARGRGRGGVRAGAIQDIVTHSGPAIAGAIAANSGLLRYFARANPPFAGPSIYSAFRMAARRRVVPRTRLKRRRRFFGKRSRKYRGRRRSYRRRCSKKVVFRFAKELDGSTAITEGYINTLSPKGGVWKFIANADNVPDIKEEFGAEFTHMKIARVYATYVPETHCCPTLDEVAKNANRSLPAMFKSYHTGSTVPASVKKLCGSQGAIAMDPQKKHRFSWVPLYMRLDESGARFQIKPRNHWLPFEQVKHVSPLNGPIIAWTTYKLPSDVKVTPEQSIRFKWIVKFKIILGKFLTYTDNSKFAESYVKPKVSYVVGNIAKDISSVKPIVTAHDVKD